MTYRVLASADRTGAPIEQPELTELYRHPDPGDRAWVRTNFVSTLDGAAQGPDGRAGTINTPSDRLVFALQRALADVILVGAGTVRAEGYHAVDLEPWQTQLRHDLGLSPYPTLAIVSGSCLLPADVGVVASGKGGPVLIMTRTSSRPHRPDFEGDTEVVELPANAKIAAPDLVAELNRRGLRRVLCEGGPHLNWTMHAADLIDEVCLTMSPMIIGGEGIRTAVGPLLDHEHYRLAHCVTADDDALLLRYLRDDASAP